MRAIMTAGLLMTALAGAAAADDVDTALRAPARLPLRAHTERIGAFGLTAETVARDAFHARGEASFDDVPVVAVRGALVRIVHDDDDARMMLWVLADDLAPAVVRETRVSGKGEVGVWLLPGARVTASGGGARRRVTATFPGDVVVKGTVPASALGKVFAPGAAPPPAGEPRQALRIFDAPGGRPLLRAPAGLTVSVIAPGAGDWLLVEHRTRTLRVRGWMRAHDGDEPLGFSTTGGGGGYGMTHTARVGVRAGTCFHAAPDGPIVGVQLADAQRYTPDHQDGWWKLYVGNAWGLFTVHARATAVDADGTPTFARCPGR